MKLEDSLIFCISRTRKITELTVWHYFDKMA